jgi:hypothetical protein
VRFALQLTHWQVLSLGDNGSKRRYSAITACKEYRIWIEKSVHGHNNTWAASNSAPFPE